MMTKEEIELFRTRVNFGIDIKKDKILELLDEIEYLQQELNSTGEFLDWVMEDSPWEEAWEEFQKYKAENE